MLRVRSEAVLRPEMGVRGCTITKCLRHSTTWHEYRWLSSFDSRAIVSSFGPSRNSERQNRTFWTLSLAQKPDRRSYFGVCSAGASLACAEHTPKSEQSLSNLQGLFLKKRVIQYFVGIDYFRGNTEWFRYIWIVSHKLKETHNNIKSNSYTDINRLILSLFYGMMFTMMHTPWWWTWRGHCGIDAQMLPVWRSEFGRGGEKTIARRMCRTKLWVRGRDPEFGVCTKLGYNSPALNLRRRSVEWCEALCVSKHFPIERHVVVMKFSMSQVFKKRTHTPF